MVGIIIFGHIMIIIVVVKNHEFFKLNVMIWHCKPESYIKNDKEHRFQKWKILKIDEMRTDHSFGILEMLDQSSCKWIQISGEPVISPLHLAGMIDTSLWQSQDLDEPFIYLPYPIVWKHFQAVCKPPTSTPDPMSSRIGTSLSTAVGTMCPRYFT